MRKMIILLLLGSAFTGLFFAPLSQATAAEQAIAWDKDNDRKAKKQRKKDAALQEAMEKMGPQQRACEGKKCKPKRK